MARDDRTSVRLFIWLRTGEVIEQACFKHQVAKTTRRLMARGCYARVWSTDHTRESLSRVDRIEWTT
jgi:hypothetical protein